MMWGYFYADDADSGWPKMGGSQATQSLEQHSPLDALMEPMN